MYVIAVVLGMGALGTAILLRKYGPGSFSYSHGSH